MVRLFYVTNLAVGLQFYFFGSLRVLWMWAGSGYSNYVRHFKFHPT